MEETRWKRGRRLVDEERKKTESFFIIFGFFFFLSFPSNRQSVLKNSPSPVNRRNHALRQRGAGRRRQDHRRADGAGMKKDRESGRGGERETEVFCFFSARIIVLLFFSRPRNFFRSPARGHFDSSMRWRHSIFTIKARWGLDFEPETSRKRC